MSWPGYLEILLHRNGFATPSQFYSNAVMQELEKMLEIHSQLRHTFAWTSRNSPASRRFRNYKEIGQSGGQDYIHCENVESEEFSIVYDDLSRARSAPVQERGDVVEIPIQIRPAPALTSPHSPVIAGLTTKQSNGRR